MVGRRLGTGRHCKHGDWIGARHSWNHCLTHADEETYACRCREVGCAVAVAVVAAFAVVDTVVAAVVDTVVAVVVVGGAGTTVVAADSRGPARASGWVMVSLCTQHRQHITATILPVAAAGLAVAAWTSCPWATLGLCSRERHSACG